MHEIRPPWGGGTMGAVGAPWGPMGADLRKFNRLMVKQPWDPGSINVNNLCLQDCILAMTLDPARLRIVRQAFLLLHRTRLPVCHARAES